MVITLVPTLAVPKLAFSAVFYLFLEDNLCLHEELQVLQQFQVSCSNLKKEKAIKIMKGKVTKSVRVP